MCTRIEKLPVELWFDIFRFLTPEHVASAFSELNSFFDSLLASPQLPTIFRIKIDRCHAYPILKTFERWRTVKLEWIQALDTSECVQRGCVVQFLRYHAPRLVSLRSLKVYIRAKRAASNLDYFCKALSQLCWLQTFQLKCTQGPVAKTLSVSIAELFKTILQFPCLRYCTLDLWSLQEDNFDQESITDLPSNHSIEYLSIDNVDRRILFDIVSCCHGLKSLIAQRNTREDIFVQASTYHPIKPLSLPVFSTLKLSICNLRFNELEHMCAATSLYLRRLQLVYSVHVFTNHYEDYLDYFDRTRWTNLLENIEVVNVTIKIIAFDDVAKDIISNMAKMDSWFKWIESKTVSSYADLTIKRPN
jgi:hypothetical protein